MRSAAPIEGQLSFGVLLEEPVTEEPSEPEEGPSRQEVAAPARPPPEPRAALPALSDDAAERAPAPADERADPQDWRAILDFERGWTGSPGAKQRAVRDRFGIGSARYHQLLDRALERPEALVYDPALVGRLRRVRDTRRRKRFAEPLQVDPPVDASTERRADVTGDRPAGPATGQGGGGG